MLAWRVRTTAGRAAHFKLSPNYFVHPVQVPVEQLEMILGPGAVLLPGGDQVPFTHRLA